MGRAARVVGRFIVSLVASLLAGEVPHIGPRHVGLQTADVTLDREHTHHEGDAFVAVTSRTAVAAITPPDIPFVPAPDFPWAAVFAHYEKIRRHPAYYMQPASDAAVIWYAAEQEALWKS
jgi:hypothetical protein